MHDPDAVESAPLTAAFPTPLCSTSVPLLVAALLSTIGLCAAAFLPGGVASQHTSFTLSGVLPGRYWRCSAGSPHTLRLHHVPAMGEPQLLAAALPHPPVLDRERFGVTQVYAAVSVAAKQCGDVVKALGKHKLTPGKVKPVGPDPNDPARRVILLDYRPDDELPPAVTDLVVQYGLKTVQQSVVIGYERLSADEVLRQVMPPGIPIPTSFEQVGHIAHLNLKPAHEPYKHIIGQVFLDKVPTLRTVVNKLANIETEFREFKMEVLAGEPDFQTEVKQHGCTFRFDYSKVYWNSRLQTEHARLCDVFGPSDCVYDVMAGIGPFAIPAALGGHRVVKANDLNGHAYEAMKANVALNKVAVDCFNMDGREFIRLAIRTFMNPEAIGDGDGVGGLPREHHFVMNLPALAVTFLDAFAILDSLPHVPRPIIHVYCFSKDANPAADALRQVETVVGRPVPPADVLHIHDVRNVAPAKEMMCVSFRYPAPLSGSEAEEPDPKRQKTVT
eukprot:GGOE01043040.1.p1 GENE.GGOE01043040.1~~GGOE01043040.1.p1  ORF type:complete len:502 (+),score=132.03 GGOE01043040.1:48-1553(+)